MKGRIATLAVSLFIALLISPAVPQEGLFSPWVLWGVPLLTAALVFSVLSGLVFGPARVARMFSAGGPKKSGEASQGLEGDTAEASGLERSAGDFVVGPDAALADAMSELDPANYLDLARALEEMGRDADALEVLAHIVEAREGENADELAEALRRMRQRLGPDNTGDA